MSQTFTEFWYGLDASGRVQLAKDADIHYQYLHNIAKGSRKPGIETYVKLSQVDPRITVRMLRPDLFGENE